MAADAAQIQQLLANLQNQIATVSSMAGQLGVSQVSGALGQVGNNNPDIAAIVKATVAAELRSRAPTTMSPSATVTSPSNLFPSNPVPQAAPQLAAPAQTAETQVIPQLAAPQAQQAQPSQQSMQEVMMKDFMNQLKLAIGGAMSVDQQRWISGNLFGLPEFFRSQDGKDTVLAVLGKYHQYIEAQPK